MPAATESFGRVRPRERFTALVAVALVQAVLALALLSGFRVQAAGQSEAVERLISIVLPKPPPPPPPPPQQQRSPKLARQSSSAPKTTPDRIGGSPGPVPAHALPSVAPIVPINPTAAPSGGGTGTGPALGSGTGGGAGGNGYGN